jgi:mannose-6-phosphate isomerase-like protein (cupin superfamily)
MQIPNADYLERTGTEAMGARLWRLPPRSANTLHKHIRAEEFYFVLEGLGRLRVGTETLTVPKHGGVLVGPDQLRQVFNDTDEEVLWLIIGAPEELEFLKGSLSEMDLSLIYPVDPKQLPAELADAEWPPKQPGSETKIHALEEIDYAAHALTWIEAWNAHDLEAILSHYADDVELTSQFVAALTGRSDGTIRGKAALRDYFQRALEAYPDLRFQFVQLSTGVRSCVLEYRSVNRLRAAETLEFDARGKVRRVLAHYRPEEQSQA